MSKSTIDANDKGNYGDTLTLSNATIITMYAFGLSGMHREQRIGLEVSPDAEGDRWVHAKGFMRADENPITYTIAAKRARACVFNAEGSDSSVEIHLIAR